MNGTIDDRYFEWLYSHVASVRNRNPTRSFWDLTRTLYTTEFTWFVHNDDNRVMDGQALRQEFIEIYGIDDIDRRDWLTMGCSFLEMLIALGRRAAFESKGSPADWFWLMLKNLELLDYSDDVFEISIFEAVKEALERINQRTYEADGRGGLFPLRYPREDQRHVEIRYQLAAYLLEDDRWITGPRI